MHPEHLKQLNSLNRIEGQVRGIKKMVEDRRYCVDILTQTKAVTAALRRVEQGILKTHIHHCLKAAVDSKDPVDINDKIHEIMVILDKRI